VELDVPLILRLRVPSVGLLPFAAGTRSRSLAPLPVMGPLVAQGGLDEFTSKPRFLILVPRRRRTSCKCPAAPFIRPKAHERGRILTASVGRNIGVACFPPRFVPFMNEECKFKHWSRPGCADLVSRGTFMRKTFLATRQEGGACPPPEGTVEV